MYIQEEFTYVCIYIYSNIFIHRQTFYVKIIYFSCFFSDINTGLKTELLKKQPKIFRKELLNDKEYILFSFLL